MIKRIKKIAYMLIILAISSCFIPCSLLYANPPITQSPLSVPVPKVLQTPLSISKANIATMSLHDRLLAEIDKMHKAYSTIRFRECPSGWFGLEEVYYSGLNSYVKRCANKSYSVQDQKNAGCLGSETVDQCTNKLFRYCLSRYEQDKTGYKQLEGTLKSRMAKGIEKSDGISKSARELSDSLKTINALMP